MRPEEPWQEKRKSVGREEALRALRLFACRLAAGLLWLVLTLFRVKGTRKHTLPDQEPIVLLRLELRVEAESTRNRHS